MNGAPSNFYLSTIEEDVALTALITEDDVIGYQHTHNGIDLNYAHKHVLRDVVSVNYSGDLLYFKRTAMEATPKVVSNYAIPSE